MGDDRRQPPDRTAPIGRFDDDDATRVRPPSGDLDETRVRPAGTSDGTRMLPPVEADPYADQPRWEARASVPPPGAGPATEYPYYDEPAPPPDDRNWMRPLLFGVIGLVLLIVLLTGVWLIFTADDEPPAPQASVPPAATAPATTATSPPPAVTTAPPTTAQPETVKVPDDLLGLDEDEARQKITDAGLRVQVSRRVDATMAPGTVIEVQPGPGSDVEPNSVVRIVVASAPRPSASQSREDGTGSAPGPRRPCRT